MQKYLIYMDVSGDIDSSVIEKYGVRFIPMEYSLGDEMRVCNGKESEEILKQFYDGQRKGDLTKTTQINPQMYEEYLSGPMGEGYSVVYLCLSGGLSATYESACTAKAHLKEKFPNVDLYVVNTLAGTGGMGVLCERACRNQEKGLSAEENFKDLVAATKKIRHWFMVQDLMYLKRGGRISASTAVIGSVLNIKPILKIDENGKLVTIDKKRGNNNAVNALYTRFKESYDASSGDVVYVIDADDKALGDSLKEKLEAEYPAITVRRCTLCPIIGAHTGPGLIAVCHMGK